MRTGLTAASQVTRDMHFDSGLVARPGDSAESEETDKGQGDFEGEDKFPNAVMHRRATVLRLQYAGTPTAGRRRTTGLLYSPA